MDRQQYLRELEARLSNRMRPNELESVMRYYEEYFEEAGPQGEAQAILDLGSPADLTARIMGQQVIKDLERRAPEEEEPYIRPRRGVRSVWTIILAICAAPIAIPVMIGLVAAGIGLLIGVFAIFLALGISGVAAVIYGILSAAAGFGAILTHGMSTTMVFVGGGMAAAGVGALLLAGSFALTGLCLRGVARLLGRVLRRKERRYE